MSHEAKIYIGTSGWSYPKGEGIQKGHFYPPGKTNSISTFLRSLGQKQNDEKRMQRGYSKDRNSLNEIIIYR